MCAAPNFSLQKVLGKDTCGNVRGLKKFHDHARHHQVFQIDCRLLQTLIKLSLPPGGKCALASHRAGVEPARGLVE